MPLILDNIDLGTEGELLKTLGVVVSAGPHQNALPRCSSGVQEL